MHILSSFTLSHLQAPLEYLLKEFCSETVTLQYTNTNLTIKILELAKSEKSQSVVIFFRLFDLLIEFNEAKITKIDEVNFQEILKEFINLIINLKKIRKDPLIIVLCPSLYKENISKNNNEVVINLEILRNFENSFLKEMKENEIYTISHANIESQYNLSESNIVNPVEGETHIPYVFKYYIALGNLLVRKFHSITLPPYKVMIVDCDNTLWSGIAGDIGAGNVEFKEHNLALQKFLVKQKENGVFICLCSKNEEETVNNVFAQREGEMILKMSDIALKKINRDTKSNNIKAILSELKLANAKNAIFIDDSEREIEEVSQNLQEIFCVLMPQKIEEFNNTWAFDINEYLSITQTDKDRLKLVQQEEKLTRYFSQIKNPIESLKAKRELKPLVISKVEKGQENEIERIVQMPKKINQFNLSPFSYRVEEEMDIEDLLKNDKIICFIGTIENKSMPDQVFEKGNTYSVQGDLTALAICKSYPDHLLVDGFFLSCRNTGLEVEYALLKSIADFAGKNSKNKIKIKFIKTEVNKLAETFVDILCQEFNKNSLIRFLLKNTNKTSRTHASIKYIFKKFNLLPKDFDKNIKEEIVFEFSSATLAQLDPYELMRKTMEINAIVSNFSTERLISKTDLANAKLYLSLLQKETETIEPLVEKFFTGSEFKLCHSSRERIIEKIKFLLSYQSKNFPQNVSLVQLGLDSLKATYLSASIYEEEKIIVDIFELLSCKTTLTSLFDYINQQQAKQSVTKIKCKLSEIKQDCFPVSMQQQRIWFAEQKEQANNSANYHMTACYKVSKNLDMQRFEVACQDLIKLYDVFGTTFFIKGKELKQKILEPEKRQLNFQVKNLKSEKLLEEMIRIEISKPWSMGSKAPLIRFIIFEDGENYHIFIHVHHAIFDAISLKNCLDTLSRIYQNKLTPNTSKLIDHPPQYIEFIYDQQRKLEDEVYQTTALNFWKNALSKIETVTTLPYDQSLLIFKPATELAAKRYSFTLSSQDLSALKNLAQSTSVTCFSALIAIFSLLMSSYTYQKHITLITATNGRNGHPNFDKMIGFFVNLLVYQFDLERNEIFVDFLKNVNEKILTSQKFQDTSFKIPEILSAQGVKNILSSLAFIYQAYPISKLILGNEIAELAVPKQPIIFDLRDTCRFGPFAVFAQENKQELTFNIEYASDLFSLDFIESIAKNFVHTIRNVCDNPTQSLQNVSLVCDEEREQLISLSQGPKLDSSGKISIANKFQQIVHQYSENIALSDNKIQLSYKEVDQQSTNLAHALIEVGVKQGYYIGIFLDTNYLFFIAELAAIKIGAVFIPLSKENPNERLQLIINDAKIKFFIVDDNHKGLFDSNLQDVQLISINSVNNFPNLEKKLPQLNESTDEFCVLYTSGSTGTPKGVILQEKGILRVVESPNFIEILPGEKMAQTANQAFDAAQLECWLAWYHGASLILFDKYKQEILDSSLFQNKLRTEKITHMWLTSGLFELHANNQPGMFATKDLKTLMVGGDVVHKDAVLKVLSFKEAPTIISGYGPTEASIFVLTHVFSKQTINAYNTTLIGSPINETEIEIITLFGSKAPLGAIGELVVKGKGVAKGYLNSMLNKDRFIGELDNRSYQTGDLVKYTTKDPQVMFVGRKDTQQVKINGNLVALEEVRSCLLRHPAVEQVKVLVTNINGISQLVAFYTLKFVNMKFIKSANEEFHDYLIKSLPAYMFPTFYRQLDGFKLNINGKLDQTQFKFEEKFNEKQLEEIPPPTSNGKAILKIIKERLPAFPNNIKENFMYFGCNSIAAVEIISRINKEFETELFRVRDLYENPTIQGLEDVLNKKLNNEDRKGLLRILKKGDSNYPPIIFIHPAGGGLSCFNNLVRRLEFANICYGIEDPLLDRKQLKLLTMVQMAQNYLLIITNEIQGRFILAGYSFGGMLALEMAAQYELTSENDFLLGIVLFDTWMVSRATKKIKDKLKQDVLIYCDQQRKEADLERSSPDMIDLLEKLCKHHQEIGFEFKPKNRISTPTYLLKAVIVEKQFNEISLENKENYLSDDVENLHIRETEATHFDMLTNANENSLVTFFSEQVNDLNKNLHLNRHKKLSGFFPLSEVNNPKLHDPKLCDPCSSKLSEDNILRS